MEKQKLIAVLKDQIARYDLMESTERFTKLGKECADIRDDLTTLLNYVYEHEKEIFNDGKCFKCADKGFIVEDGVKYKCPDCGCSLG